MKKTSGIELAKKLKIAKSRGIQAVMKAQFTTAILKEVSKQGLTHAALAKKARLSRTTVTGILTGSLQKVTLDRVLKLVEAVGLVPEVKLKKAA